jgi:uncharacterized protein (DUF433 family)
VDLPDFLDENESGDIRIRGRRIGLYHVVEDFRGGKPVPEIADDFELSDALVQAVIDFYHAHVGEVDAYMAERDAETERLMKSPLCKTLDLAELQRRFAVQQTKAV